MGEPVIQAQATQLSRLFYKGKFEVPWHQRYYDWEKENVEDLLEDLLEAYKKKSECYFLGTIVLIKKSDGVWEINDGQQRMVTFSLLIRILLNSRDSIDERQLLRIPFILDENHQKDLSDVEELSPRLIPPEDDKTGYYALIRGETLGAKTKLMKAKDAIDAFVSKISEKNLLKDFVGFIMQKVEVAYIEFQLDLDKNSVFEALNARGKPLEAFDLIRNYLYSFFPSESKKERLETVHDSLKTIHSCFKGKANRAEDYMHCYLQCQYGFLAKKRLYREMKAQMEKSTSPLENQAFDLVKESSRGENTSIFHTILSPKEDADLVKEFLKDSHQEEAERNAFIFLNELKDYKVVQPITFALLYRYCQEKGKGKKKRLAKFVHARLKFLTSFFMRTVFVVGKLEPSHFAKEFANLAQSLMTSNDLKSVPFKKILEENDKYNVLDDSSFIKKMKEAKMQAIKKAKQFFLSLSRCTSSKLMINESQCTIEHILPKSKTYLPSWKNFNEGQHKEYFESLGNLTLLNQASNKSDPETNKAFSKKKDIYEESGIKLTEDIAEFSDWSPQSIQKRQEELAKLASEVWSIDLLK